MGQEIKLIRKQFRITRQEEKQIKEMMREQKVDSFSEFLRQNLLKKNYQDNLSAMTQIMIMILLTVQAATVKGQRVKFP